ncbi:cytochrome b [Brevundimonas sp.]|uniref:cytochrome b n=1 Tax=Brevundimonas sp. TaxID=1871086 RepID=UPI0025BB2040|nr:cytochrome b [Brevundimonas sp.]
MIVKPIQRVLEWAAGHADEGRYSPVGIVFHWTMAVLVLFQLFWGWLMNQLRVGGDMVAAYDLHYAIGVLMLVLALARLGWRLLAPGPINDADKPGWQSIVAHVTAWVFYICLLGLPLTGWAMISATAREQQPELLWLVKFPLMPMQELTNSQRWAIEAVAEWMHWGLIVTLLVLIPMHVGAALKHHFIDRDDVVHGMLPVLPQLPRRRTRWQRRWLAMETWVGSRARGLWRRFRDR